MNPLMSTLGEYLDALYNRYDRRFLTSDPVQFSHAYNAPKDQELVAFLASQFAFGNVASVLATVRRILTPLGFNLYSALLAVSPSMLREWYRGFVHRWVADSDLVALLEGLQQVLRQWHSLRAPFLAHYHPPKRVRLFLDQKSPTLFHVGPALSEFVRELRGAIPTQNRALRFLLNDPATGTACKRLVMFLRWVVRPADGIDLGLWPEVDPAHLIVPVDTHVARISRFLGLTKRRTTNWKMAVEITDRLRAFDPRDPMKYDFGISRIGIVEGCRGYRHPKICPACPLNPVCHAPDRAHT